MANLSGQESEIEFTVQITRAETGKVEEHTLTGTVSNEELEKLKTEYPNIKEK